MDTSLNSELPAALPSVVMAILSYKQEDRIGYAVDSVLAQDYEGPLTIILSDDCSPDGTFDIIKRKAEQYKGRHKIILNRNETNMGIAAHLYKVCHMVRSDYFCRLDGDDYAFKDRVSTMVNALEMHPEAMLATAKPCQYYVKPGEIPDFAAHVQEGTGEVSIWPDKEDVWCWGWGGQVMYRGCTVDKLDADFAAYRGFGEDRVMEFLSRAYGDTLFIDRELTAYVIHNKNMSIMGDAKRFAPWKEYKGNHDHFIHIARNRHKVNTWVRQWIVRYMSTHDDIQGERLEWGECYVRHLEGILQELAVHVAYNDRGFLHNICHWLRYRDARYTKLIPLWLKWTLLGVISFLRKAKKDR